MSTIENFYKTCQNSNKTIGIIGDSMIDEYYDIFCNRISPEFSIPVYLSKTTDPTRSVPGGAANVILQFQNFKQSTKLISLLNQKTETLYTKQHNINTINSIIDDSIIVPIKRRIYSKELPLTRWDIEDEDYGIEENLPNLLSTLKVPECDAYIFSDYNKGMFKYPWFRSILNKDKITVVDPKTKDIDKWQNCTIFKPNAIEAKELSGKNNWKDQLQYFMRILKCKGVVITQAGDGVVGCYETPDNTFEIQPKNKNITVESVIGAGDCFISTLTLALTLGYDLKTASELGFLSGRSYVKRKHNSPNNFIDLYEETEDFNKIIKFPEILATSKHKLVMTNGCFDILHSGHIQSLNFAKSKGEKLVVAVNSDESVKKLKGDSRPINPIEQRMSILANLACVDYVVEFNEETPIEIIKKIQPDALVKSEPYTIENIIGADLVKEVHICPKKIDISTTKIIENSK